MSRRAVWTALLGGMLLLAALVVLPGCTWRDRASSGPRDLGPGATTTEHGGRGPEADRSEESGAPPRGEVTLAFAGDVHFELQHRALLSRAGGALGAITGALRDADLAMVNLETAITERGRPAPKKYRFRTDARALDVLDRAGVDVVTMANNHAVDYGAVGLRDTLEAQRSGPVPVVGVGSDEEAAFAAHRTRVGQTEVSFLGASARREYTMANWSAGEDSPGIAAARRSRPAGLIGAVEREDRRSDVVVVYLHWGEENARCPDQRQRTMARSLVAAGADVIVGAHAHVLQGSGWLGDSYVSYGLGNFVWYHNYRQEDTGVLRVQIEDGDVVGDRWVPARADVNGTLPRPLTGPAREEALTAWQGLRGCAGLAATR